MEHNTLSKGPHTDNETTAVAIGAEGMRNPTNSLVIRDNSVHQPAADADGVRDTTIR